MKFYKKLSLNTKDPMNERFAIRADDKIVTTSQKSIQIPSGPTTSRPAISDTVNGDLRYNNDIPIGGNFEGFIGGVWKILKANAPQDITQQIFLNGNYANMYFGPLSYNVDVSRPQNVLVYVENVPQISVLNYTLTKSDITTTTLTSMSQDISTGSTVLNVFDVGNYNIGNVIVGNGIAAGTTVVSSNPVTKTISISTGTLGLIPKNATISTTFYTPPITISTTVTTSISSGTLIIPVTSVGDFKIGQVVFGSNLQANTKILSVDPVALTVTIDTPVVGIMSSSTILTTSFNVPGTYINFNPDTLPVPNKPVVALVGFDGFIPTVAIAS